MLKNRHIYEMGIVGNCAFLSYIDKVRANIVWQCWPRFDSSFVFGSLLDEKRGGEFSISPAGENYKSFQYYIRNTNVLVTEFECEDGKYRVIDFAPRFQLYERFHKPLTLFRKIERITGSPKIRVICRPMGDYGRLQGHGYLGSNHIAYGRLDEEIRLTTNCPRSYIMQEKAFFLTEDKYLVLSYGTPLEAPLSSTYEDFYRRTVQYWRQWVQRSNIPFLYQDEIIRSSLLLKIHQYEDTGAIIASGTTSLPEHPRSGRTWDYRYCWIRDSYFTLNALDSVAHFEEMEGYSHYIQNLIYEETSFIQPVYKIDGVGPIPESELDLFGYDGNRPVRIGNDAYTQKQNDVFGQMILSLLPLYVDRRLSGQGRPPLSLMDRLLDFIQNTMDQPDSGIWEYRSRRQRHCESYLFHWAGAKAAFKIAREAEDVVLMKRAERLAQEATQNIELCYRKQPGVYAVAQESDALNASEYLLITMNYLDNRSERARRHYEQLTRSLQTKNDLIYRYQDPDDFGETHSSFMICAFWQVEALACLGKIDEARDAFENLLKASNSLGIFSEDVDPADFSQWGNFGQTYSHVGLINAAFRINQRLDRRLFE